jgi:hypothetical protein
MVICVVKFKDTDVTFTSIFWLQTQNQEDQNTPFMVEYLTSDFAKTKKL